MLNMGIAMEDGDGTLHPVAGEREDEFRFVERKISGWRAFSA
jgi:hypothetical protein